ncbi:YidB family protein [Seohaeicola sp. SP36]|uniref:YidB family protein n=1 Tax=unclassified Seohaeicola TaxID=2641111 RepID=UPI00237AF291|nr:MULTISPECIES: YidB family protein [unclassified Seohaeicola]MDD9707146.1 YidB family protein [Seohaeicola sp. 4SK31]MDD9735387.1 YidB family protein [Seohaeicola sp. SP36]
MSKSTPSLLALLGLVAVAGYQNRGCLSDMLDDARQNTGSPAPNTPERDGFLTEIVGLFQGGSPDGSSGESVLSRGLGDLVGRFRDAGRGEMAESWVSTQANRPMNVAELEDALGHETLDDLGRKTGLSREELLLRLNVALPEVVNRFTPQGRLPTGDEMHGLT